MTKNLPVEPWVDDLHEGEMIDEQPGELGDELRRKLVADTLPGNERGAGYRVGEDLCMAPGEERVLGSVDDERRYPNVHELVGARGR